MRNRHGAAGGVRCSYQQVSGSCAPSGGGALACATNVTCWSIDGATWGAVGDLATCWNKWRVTSSARDGTSVEEEVAATPGWGRGVAVNASGGT